MWIRFNRAADKRVIEQEKAEVDEFFVEIAGHTYSFKEEPETERFIISEVKDDE